MPKAVEQALEKAGRKKGYKGKRLGHFVYGIMMNMAKSGKISPWGALAKRKMGG